MSEEQMVGIVEQALVELGVAEQVVAAGQFMPRGHTGSMFAGGFVGDSLAGSTGSLGDAIGTAGGALAGIVIAFMQGLLTDFSTKVEVWSTRNNPLFSADAFEEGRPFYAVGEWLQRWNLFTPELPNLMSLVPFAALVFTLWWIGRDRGSRAH